MTEIACLKSGNGLDAKAIDWRKVAIDWSMKRGNRLVKMSNRLVGYFGLMNLSQATS